MTEFDILIKNCSEIERLTNTVGQFLGHPLTLASHVEWILYTTEASGLDISVFEAEGFVNDAGIEFERYSLMVGIKGLSMMSTVQHFEEWFRLFSLTLANVIAQQLECECLVIKNLAHIVGAFSFTSETVSTTPTMHAAD